MSATKRIAKILHTDETAAIQFIRQVNSHIHGRSPSYKKIASALEKYPTLKADPRALADKIGFVKSLHPPVNLKKDFDPWILALARQELEKKESDTGGSVHTVRGGLPGSGRRS